MTSSLSGAGAAYDKMCAEVKLKPNASLAQALSNMNMTVIKASVSPLDGKLSPTKIDLGGLYFGPRQIILLARLIPQYFPLLNSVDVSGNGLNSESIVALANVLKESSTVEKISVKSNPMDSGSGDMLLELVKHNYRISWLDASDCALPDRLVEGMALQCSLNRQKQREYHVAVKEGAVTAQAELDVPRCLTEYVWETASNAGDITLDDDVALNELELAMIDDSEAADEVAPSITAVPTPSAANDSGGAGGDAARTSLNVLPKYPNVKECLATITMCSSSDLFTDSAFPANIASITGIASTTIPPSLAHIQWRRLSELLPAGDIIVDGRSPIEANSVVRTRWFGSAANALRNLDLMRAATCVKAHPDLGLYVFRFYKNATPVDIVVDDFVPCWDMETLAKVASGSTNSIAQKSGAAAAVAAAAWPVATMFHAGSLNDVWITLLEKAYAKLHGSYQRISRGSTSSALQDLTGGAASKVKWSLGDLRYHGKALYDAIRRATVTRCVVLVKATSTSHMQSRAFEACGLVPNVYYAVEASVPAGPHFVVRLSSPSADYCWNGRFSRQSAEAEQYRDDLKYHTIDVAEAFGKEVQQYAQDGAEECVQRKRATRRAPCITTPSFWIAVEELAAFFSSMIILRYPLSDMNSLAVRSVSFRGALTRSALQGVSAYFPTNPAFLLQAVKHNTEVVVQLSQRDARLPTAGGGSPTRYRTGLQLVAVRSTAASLVSLRQFVIEDGDIVAKTPIAYNREVGLSVTIDADQPLLFFASCTDLDQDGGVLEYEVRATATQRYDMISLPLKHAVTAVEGVWDASSAAGRLIESQRKKFLANPQFVLRPQSGDSTEGGMSEPQQVTVYLEQVSSSTSATVAGTGTSVARHSIGLLALDGETATSEALLLPAVEWTHRRHNVVSGSFQLAGPMLLVPSTWNSGEEGAFRLVVFHDRPISLRRREILLDS